MSRPGPPNFRKLALGVGQSLSLLAVRLAFWYKMFQAIFLCRGSSDTLAAKRHPLSLDKISHFGSYQAFFQ
jgi:hypothetical protein